MLIFIVFNAIKIHFRPIISYFSPFFGHTLPNVTISESNPMVLQKYVLVLWLYLSFSVENESRNLIFDQFPVC